MEVYIHSQFLDPFVAYTCELITST